MRVDFILAEQNAANSEQPTRSRGRITIPEIAARLGVGRQLVYEMLERGFIPGIRVGRPWIVTRHAYEHWEKTCGDVDPASTTAPAK